MLLTTVFQCMTLIHVLLLSMIFIAVIWQVLCRDSLLIAKYILHTSDVELSYIFEYNNINVCMSVCVCLFYYFLMHTTKCKFDCSLVNTGQTVYALSSSFVCNQMIMMYHSRYHLLFVCKQTSKQTIAIDSVLMKPSQK